jgi:hypothetical protein
MRSNPQIHLSRLRKIVPGRAKKESDKDNQPDQIIAAPILIVHLSIPKELALRFKC